jgi:hypothetical protein
MKKRIKLHTRESNRALSIARTFAALAILAAFAVAFVSGPLAGIMTTVALAAFVQTLSPASAVLGFRNQLRFPNFNAVGSNQKATLDVPRGLAYHDISINVQDGGADMTVAQMKQRIDSIVIKIDGKAVQEWTPTTLDALNSTNGARYAAIAGWLTLYFSEPWNRTLEGEERGAWGTDGIQTFVIEIKFNANATAPGLTAYANVEEANRPFRAFPVRHIRTLSGMPVVSGVSQIPNPLKEVGLFYRRIHFFSSLVTSANVAVNKVVKWENIPRALVGKLMAERGLSQQANVYSLAFDLTSQQLTDQLASFINDNGTLKEIADFRIEYTGSGAGTADVVHELYQVFK